MNGQGMMAHAPQPASSVTSITLLGSTGTIGRNTLDILAMHPERFTLRALTAGGNVSLLAEQALAFRPELAVIADEACYAELRERLHGSGIAVAAGAAAVDDAARLGSDMVMSAIVGAAGLAPTLTAIRAKSQIALANKECLVCAGSLMMHEAERHGVRVIPVDSEHNAVFQLFDQERAHSISQITLTASGGPFRTASLEEMRQATPAQAIRHPNWNMGAKISVDSATMMNKCLELIEAFYLFPLKAEQLHVLVHPQSIVHCLVHYIDGSVLAQLSHPDMRTPIAHALGWPERIGTPVKPLDLASIGQLSFEAPDSKRFPALALAPRILAAGGNAATVMNAANEIAVKRFLDGEIGFLDIVKIVEKTMEKIDNTPLNTIDDVLAADQAARRVAWHA